MQISAYQWRKWNSIGLIVVVGIVQIFWEKWTYRIFELRQNECRKFSIWWYDITKRFGFPFELYLEPKFQSTSRSFRPLTSWYKSPLTHLFRSPFNSIQAINKRRGAIISKYQQTKIDFKSRKRERKSEKKRELFLPFFLLNSPLSGCWWNFIYDDWTISFPELRTLCVIYVPHNKYYKKTTAVGRLRANTTTEYEYARPNIRNNNINLCILFTNIFPYIIKSNLFFISSPFRIGSWVCVHGFFLFLFFAVRGSQSEPENHSPYSCVFFLLRTNFFFFARLIIPLFSSLFSSYFL